MADTKKQSDAPPPPPPPPVEKPSATAATKAAQKEVKGVKGGLHPMRPFHYITSFIGGTVNGTLDGTANWGRKGSMLGIGIAALAMLSGAAAPALGLLVLGWVGGLAAGAVTGSVVGLVTGGYQGVGREYRKGKYAEDLQERAKAKKQPGPQRDFREEYRQHHVNNNYFFDRVQQQNMEVRQQERESSHTFFQDMVHASRGHRENGI